MRMTTKQVVLMTCLADKNSDGSFIDLDQLLDRLRDDYSWTTTKPSIQFSIRRLIAEDMVMKHPREKRRNRQRAVLGLTELGIRVLGR